MNKKIITIASLSVLLTGAAFFVLTSLGQTTPEPVSDGTQKIDTQAADTSKTVLSDYLLMSMAYPSLENMISGSDIAVQGQIIKTEFISIPLLTGTAADEKVAAMEPDGEVPGATFTKYTVQVEKQFLGDKAAEVIECVVLGAFDEYVTKPRGNERVVLFLCEGVQDYYTTVTFEHSIFTVDENDRLYSYSNRALSVFDGKPVSALMEETARTKQDLEKHPLP